MKSVAILLPTRNRFGLLQRTLRSLQAQTYRDFTVYVSDDGSTDETKDASAATFPGLDLVWTRRTLSFGGVVPHFNALYAEAQEDWIALAHDDEVYAPDWLEKLVALSGSRHPSGAPVVLAFGWTLTVDARHRPPRFYESRTEFPGGFYTAEELKQQLVFDGRSLPGNGFLVAKSALQAVDPMRTEYEQFDFEWLVRVAGQGITAVEPKLLQTYMIHAQNTVGSKNYLRAYFDQKNPSGMLTEWLETLTHLPPERRKQRRQELESNRSRSRFRSFLKVVATGDRKLAVEILRKLEADTAMPEKYLRLARRLCFPGVFWPAALGVKLALATQARKGHPSQCAAEKEIVMRCFPLLI